LAFNNIYDQLLKQVQYSFICEKNNINFGITLKMTDNTNINNGANETIFYVQQFKSKIFKRIPGKIRKNSQFINIFTYNFKRYHVAIGININLIDDYKKYKSNRQY
jgi:hypothetical protein